MDDKINYSKVGIYLRLSNEDRDKIDKNNDSESIKNQRNMLIQYINKHDDFILVDEYTDEDLSGAGTYRPEFERLIKDCENKKIDIVLCKSQSRFSRDMEIIEKYINNKFKEWNIRFIGLSDNADTNILGNKKSRQINGLVNEWYLEDVSNNIRSAFNSKMKMGEFISPFAPFGYEIDPTNNNKLKIDTTASLVIKKIYKLYLSGMGFTSIAKYLNKNNIPSPSLYKFQKGIKLNIISNKPREEIKWNTNAIKSILTNEIYIGNLVQGKRTTVSYKNHKIKKKNKSEWIIVKNTHEAIIDENMFNKVQTNINKRTKVLKKSGYIHIFSGKVYCLECNQRMRKKNSTKHEYLVCSNNRDGLFPCENKSSIRYDELEKLILNKINEKIKYFCNEQKLKDLYYINFKKKLDKEINLLQIKKNDIQNKINKTKYYLKNLYEDKINNIITEEQFIDLIKDYNKNNNIYKNQIKSIENKINNVRIEKLENKNNNILFNKYIKFNKLNRSIIDEFIDEIHIGKIYKETKSRDIKIKWNFK